MPYFNKRNLKQKSVELLEYISSIAPLRQSNLNIKRAALLVVDMQKYFLDKSSHAYIPSATAIIPGILDLIDEFNSLGRPIIFTRHINTRQNAGMMNKWWRDVIKENSPLSEINDKFNTAGSRVIIKSQYDAFHGTDLDSVLKEYRIDHVVITGVMTNLCCETTARAAFMRGYEVFFPVDGTATFAEEYHKASLMNLAYGFANIVTIETLLKSSG
jgi:nicotinamidase-related amidase